MYVRYGSTVRGDLPKHKICTVRAVHILFFFFFFFFKNKFLIVKQRQKKKCTILDAKAMYVENEKN